MANVELTKKQIDIILDGLYHHNEQGKLIKIMEGLSQQTER